MRISSFLGLVILLLLITGGPVLSRGGEIKTPAATYLSELITMAENRELHTTRYWHVLLHYRSDMFGWESEVDDPGFFLAGAGKTDPQAELRATLTAFFRPLAAESESDHPQCRFIARFHWLNGQLHFKRDRMPAPRCRTFETWYQAINPGSVSLIFPTYYIDAPASMFGHTLLRINGASPGQPDLLSVAVNYAALADDPKTGFVAYGFKGVFGGFKGVFTIAPYYLSVLSYNDLEQRDIWEYDLDFSEGEIIRMIYHLWELKPVYFDYYFFRENCSYHLLSLLEAARPTLRLRDRYTFWTLPSETIHDITSRPGLVTRRRYRPSRWSQFRQQLVALDANERLLAVRITRTGNLAYLDTGEGLTVERRSRVLDLLTQYYAVQQTEEADRLREQVLVKRAALRTILPPVDYPPVSTPPETGHDPLMVSFSAGETTDRAGFRGVSLRLTLHDLLDGDTGFIPQSQVEFFQARFRWYEGDRNPLLHDLTLVNVISLNARTDFQPGFSWKLDMGLRQARVSDCDDCLRFILNPGGGVGFSVLDGLFYTLGEFRYRYGAGLETPGRIAAGISLGYLRTTADVWKIHLESSLFYPADAGDLPELYQQVGVAYNRFRNHSLRLDWRRANDTVEHEVGYRYYF